MTDGETHPNAQFLIAGGPIVPATSDTLTYEEEVRALHHKLNLEENVHFLGIYENMQEFYNGCDLTVLLSRHEGTAVINAQEISASFFFNSPCIAFIANS